MLYASLIYVQVGALVGVGVLALGGVLLLLQQRPPPAPGDQA